MIRHQLHFAEAGLRSHLDDGVQIVCLAKAVADGSDLDPANFGIDAREGARERDRGDGGLSEISSCKHGSLRFPRTYAGINRHESLHTHFPERRYNECDYEYSCICSL